jgi:ribosomal protein S27AE
MFTHSNFVNVLGDLFHDELGYNLFDDFYITGMVEVLSSKGDKIYESVVDGNVVCDNCGWSWKLSEGGDDPFTCHKCGTTTSN